MKTFQKSAYWKIFLLTVLFIGLLFNVSSGQLVLDEHDLAKITGPQYIQRTMHLLAESSPERRNTVRILIYGQSLSAQDWWLKVKDYLEQQFPDANLIMDNKSIGGFASQFLVKTVRRDVLDFYPDLILFHVFGSDQHYEEILAIMRSLTTTEIMIWNDPQNQPEPNPWHEKMSYEIIPLLALKYKCKFIDLRTPIQKYVADNGLVYADEFTRDGLHFNEKGCELLASQIIPHFVYDPELEADPDQLVKTYHVGQDVQWYDGALDMEFEGNRVDIISEAASNPGNHFQIFVDGKKPSQFATAYNHTRPNDNGERGWIWGVGAPVRIQRKAPWVNESFTLTYDIVDYESRFLSFHIEGSVSGYEGEGNNREDFVSNSGRVFIQANEVNDSLSGDWHVFRTHDVTGFRIEDGYTVTWDTYLMGSDTFMSKVRIDERNDDASTLFKGIPNGRHTLKLITEDKAIPQITHIKVYRPPVIERRADGG